MLRSVIGMSCGEKEGSFCIMRSKKEEKEKESLFTKRKIKRARNILFNFEHI